MLQVFTSLESGFYEFQIQLPIRDETQWKNVQVVRLQVNYKQLSELLENET